MLRGVGRTTPQLERRGRGTLHVSSSTAGVAGTDACGPVCGICLDQPFACAVRFLVCFASLEFRIWERSGSQSATDAPRRHTHTWAWPEAEDRPQAVQRVGAQVECLALLAAPPLVASFVCGNGDVPGDLVVVTAPFAQSIFVYSCTQRRQVQRVLWHLPSPVMRFVQLSPPWVGDGTGDDGSSVMLALCSDRFVQLRISRRGQYSEWLGEPVQLAGSLGSTASSRVSRGPYGGTPDACLAVARGIGRPGSRGCCGYDQGPWVLLVKGDAAITCWELPAGSVPAAASERMTRAQRL